MKSLKMKGIAGHYFKCKLANQCSVAVLYSSGPVRPAVQCQCWEAWPGLAPDQAAASIGLQSHRAEQQIPVTSQIYLTYNLHTTHSFLSENKGKMAYSGPVIDVRVSGRKYKY